MGKILSDREYEVVEHLVYFGTKKEAAPILGITERTMETHTKNIFRKLGITKLNELVLIYCSMTFKIADQIEARRIHLTKKMKAKKKEIATGAMACVLMVSIVFEPCEFIRYRRYRRKTETQYLISFAPVTAI